MKYVAVSDTVKIPPCVKIAIRFAVQYLIVTTKAAVEGQYADRCGYCEVTEECVLLSDLSERLDGALTCATADNEFCKHYRCAYEYRQDKVK